MKKNKEFYPVAMTIAGTDSGGGAGVAADLRTFNALGAFGTCAVTAVTAQNPLGVTGIMPVDPEMVAKQIRTVGSKLHIRQVKSGMLFSADIIQAVAAAIRDLRLPLICDPVMVATSGAKLLRDDAISMLQEQMLPLADWITPNLPEASLLSGMDLHSAEQMPEAAAQLAEKFQTSVWLKGGHLVSGSSTDIIAHQGKIYRISSPALPVHGAVSHGTGCTLSAALCAALALGYPWKSAVCTAKAFVYGSLLEAVDLGPDIQGMYPPVNDVRKEVTLKEIG